MPFTFSHPAAILPFKRFCPVWLHFPALVVGSMAPDVPYFFLRPNIAHSAHTLHGSVLLSLPLGAFLLCAFYVVRKPLCYLLPMPHRALLPGASTRLVLNPGLIVAILISLMIGIWTHIFWDGFTHVGGYFVDRSSLLRHPVFQFQKITVHVYTVLQHSSSITGLALISFIYWCWLRTRVKGLVAETGETDGWRYSLVGGLAAIAFFVAVPVAAYLASKFNGYGAIKVFVVREAVCAVAFFVPAITIAAFIIAFRRGQMDRPA